MGNVEQLHFEGQFYATMLTKEILLVCFQVPFTVIYLASSLASSFSVLLLSIVYCSPLVAIMHFFYKVRIIAYNTT